MDAKNSCVKRLEKIVFKHKIFININGSILNVLDDKVYKMMMIELYCISIIGIISWIIKHYKYHPITIIGNTIYSRVCAGILSQYNIPFVLSKPSNRIVYYETDDNKEIAFEGQSYKYFDNTRDIKFVPHSDQEIQQLQDHTKLKGLRSIHDKMINMSFNNILLLRDTYLTNPIIRTKHLNNNLYYITTYDDCWISQIIISDIVDPLSPKEIISGLYLVDNELKRLNSYVVGDDLSIKLLSDSIPEIESSVYSLSNSRAFGNNQNKYIIHPFHLTNTNDPILSIAIVTIGLLVNLINL